MQWTRLELWKQSVHGSKAKDLTPQDIYARVTLRCELYVHVYVHDPCKNFPSILFSILFYYTHFFQVKPKQREASLQIFNGGPSNNGLLDFSRGFFRSTDEKKIWNRPQTLGGDDLVYDDRKLCSDTARKLIPARKYLSSDRMPCFCLLTWRWKKSGYWLRRRGRLESILALS